MMGSIKAGRKVRATVLLTLGASSIYVVDAHPLCWYGPDRAVSMTAEATFCPNSEPEGFCCEPFEEQSLQETYEDTRVSAECQDLYKEVLCGICNPYSSHLYARMGTEDGLAMTAEFCESYVTACGADLDLPNSYCAEHVLEGSKTEYWSYPLNIVADAGDNGVIAAFPNLPETSLPSEPIAMQMSPDSTKWWIAGMEGIIKEAKSDDPTKTTVVLDISDKIEHSYEQGLLGFAFSPSFSKTGIFYVSYVTSGEMMPEYGINVLSKFVYYKRDTASTHESEEVLLKSSEKHSSVHSSGWVGIPPSSYVGSTPEYDELYWTVGDGGPQNDPYNMAQDPANFHGKVIRILVPSRAYGTGYKIPSGNAFAGANGELREICATGFRNPHRCGFDKKTDELYCGDVGQELVEEVNLIECGEDYGWRLFEGSRCNDGFEGTACSKTNRVGHVFPTFEYCHVDYDSLALGEVFFTGGKDICGNRIIIGQSIVGGHIYRGSKFADVLSGHYIFADWSTGALHHLAPVKGGGWDVGTILGAGPKISAFAEDDEGELYLVGYQSNIYDLPCGQLCAGEASCMDQADVVPVYEELGCFGDDTGTRALTLAQAPACDTMSAEMCASYCAKVTGAIYFSLEYMTECYCGSEADDYTMYGELPSSACNTPCSGFPYQKCGGYKTMNVFAMTSNVEWQETGASAESVVPPITPVKLPGRPTADNYIGCYVDNEHARVLSLATTTSDGMTEGSCEKFCISEGASMYGLEYGSKCFCGDDTSDFEVYGVTATGCDTPCVGDPTVSCGGSDSIAVYTIIPTGFATNTITASTQQTSSETETPASSTDDWYVGCFVDIRHQRILDMAHTSSADMAPPECRIFCQKQGGSIYGLEWANECWCGGVDSFEATQMPESECDSPCAGDPSSMCGGTFRASVYKVY